MNFTIQKAEIKTIIMNLLKSWKIKLKSKSKLWNLLESRLSDWITLKDDDFSVYEVTETVDYLLDIKNWK